MSAPWRKILVLAAAACCAAWIIGRNVPFTTLVIDNFEEMLIFERDEASTANGIWILWSTPTFDYEEPMKTGYFHYSSLLLGALATPLLGAKYTTFAMAAHWVALLHAAALAIAAAWVLGRLSGWSPLAMLAPLLLALNPFIHARAAELRVESAMMLWELLGLWAMARFWVAPGPKSFRLAMILLTLGFAAKPTLLLLFPFFIALNLAQVWWDGQVLRTELRWRMLKGLKYGFLTCLAATPNTLFSLGLFVASMRAEIGMSAGKYARRSGWEWLSFASDPGYLGPWLLALAAALLLWLVVQQVRGWEPWRRTELDALVALSLLWTVAYWGFLVGISRSFIERYMDPGALSLLLFVAAALVRVGQGRRLAAAAALVLALLLLAPAAPQWIQAHDRYERDARRRVALLQPARDLRRWISATLPAGSAAMLSADVLFDPEHFARSTRFFRFKPYYFDVQPDVLVISEERLRTHREYLNRKIDLNNKEQVERKLSAMFFHAIRQNALYGTLESVDTWDAPKTHIYRFTKPVDAAYRDWLTAKIHEEAGIPLPR